MLLLFVQRRAAHSRAHTIALTSNREQRSSHEAQGQKLRTSDLWMSFREEHEGVTRGAHPGAPSGSTAYKLLKQSPGDQSRVITIGQKKLTEYRSDTVDREAIDDLLTTTSADLRDAIRLLIERRERMRDQELTRLNEESGQLLDKIDTIDRAKLIEELRCFRDVLALHRELDEKRP